MEQTKSRKKYIVKWICCILAVLLLGGVVYQYWYKPRYAYQPQKHTYEELLTLFEEHRPLFDEVARIISQNDRFWIEAVSYKTDSYDPCNRPWIRSPYDYRRMKLFSAEEQEVLHTFFETISPFNITLYLSDLTKWENGRKIVLDRPDCVGLHISCSIKRDDDTIRSLEFIYEYGTESEAEEDIYLRSQIYDVSIIDLGNKWYGCYWEF